MNAMLRSVGVTARPRLVGWLSPVLVSVMVAMTAGCSTTSPDVVPAGEAQRLAKVQDAVVLSVRDVVVDGTQSGAGAVAGAVVGGIGGASISGNRRAEAAGGVLGAVVGGVVGNAVERLGTREEALEILLQLSTGERRSVIQAKGKETFNPGDAVILVTEGAKVRVILAPKVVAPRPQSVQ